jgi:hypothetical protein
LIELDLPPPPSVNFARRLNKAALPKLAAWTKQADALTTLAWAGGKRPKQQLDKFEATIVVSENCGLDLDNAPKRIIDYAKRLGLIVDDSRRYMRAVHIVWGDAPEGCRLILRPVI